MAAHPSRPAIDSLTAVRSRSVVAQAFCADPLLVWLFPEDDRRLDATAAWLGLFVEAYAAAARVDTIEEDGTIVAASVWREAIANDRRSPICRRWAGCCEPSSARNGWQISEPALGPSALPTPIIRTHTFRCLPLHPRIRAAVSGAACFALASMSPTRRVKACTSRR